MTLSVYSKATRLAWVQLQDCNGDNPVLGVVCRSWRSGTVERETTLKSISICDAHGGGVTCVCQVDLDRDEITGCSSPWGRMRS